MKKFVFMAIIALLSLSAAIFASNNQNVKSTTENPQVCQFSLSRYTGTINGSHTDQITVRLSCPQATDVYATVIVVVGEDEDIIASDIFKIPANKTTSDSKCIYVPSEYNGKTYKLGVQ
ncbi:MAG: hypothetical protein J1E02_09525 [Coprobacter sp.]|nr:hypothetical protein [Coprobacter sp.]